MSQGNERIEITYLRTNWKRSVFIPVPKKGNECTVAFISHGTKMMLKILQPRLQQYVNRELPDET